MPSLFRTTVIVVALAAPLTLWAIGHHFIWIPSASQENTHCQVGEGERLEKALEHRQEARRQAVQKLFSQRCTLAQTLQRFQELNQEWPDIRAISRVAWEEKSDEEIAFRLILVYVRMVLSGQSEKLTVVLRRLQEDYQQLQSSKQIAGR